MKRSRPRVFCLLAASICLFHTLCRADVPAPATPPPPPAGYCSTIYEELRGDLQAFNILLTVPPTWKPIAGGPSLFAADLKQADGNTGPGLIGSDYLPGVLTQLQEEKALGVGAIKIEIGFPAVYAPFYGGQSGLAPYVSFYTQVAQAVKAAGLKLIVENDVLLSGDISGGWGATLGNFYNSNTFTGPNGWNNYMAARATMAATLAQTMQPDYLVLGEEPDGEAKQTGQQNMNIAADAAQMIAGEIAAVQALKLPKVKLGAGFGNWPMHGPLNTLPDYIADYVALPLDYIDFHLYPVNTEQQGPMIDNTLLIASMAAAAGKPVAMSEGWVWKMENSEWNVENGQFYRSRDPFSFWAPLDAYYLQTVQALGAYTNMLYVAPEGPDDLFVYQTYGGTVANGGAANCTCTTESCSEYDVVHAEGPLAQAANSVAEYSNTGLSYASQLIVPPDEAPPSTPSGLAGSANYSQATLSWNASTDNVGVAGYNVYRCQPPEEGHSCTGVWIANATSTGYKDSAVAEGTPYNYQVQAFDLANNNSPLSETVSVQTLKSPQNAPSKLVATAVSATEVSLTWSAPEDSAGLTGYLVYAGTSTSNLRQAGTAGASATAYTVQSLSPTTLYYFGVAAVESGITSPTSPLAWASTYAMPNPPTGLTATPSGDTSIVLTWQDDMPHGGLPTAAYQVLRGDTSGVLTKVAQVTTTTYTNESLKPGTTYYYEVLAIDTGGDTSQPSSQVSATTP
jgi:fibronectin type 3 domain-containing protein